MMGKNIKKGCCYGVSVGPGRGELMTLEAMRIIKESDIICLPSYPKEECTAYKIVKDIYPEIDEKDMYYETFTMSRDAGAAKKRHDEIFEEVSRILDEGRNAAFLALGEVALYSTYLYIHEKLLKAGYESVLINGITSVQAVCAKLGIPLAMGNEQLHIFPDTRDIEAKLTLPGTKVFMKPKGSLLEILDRIEAFLQRNPEYEIYGISKCGMDGEIAAKGIKEAKRLEGYFTVLIVTGDNPGYEPNASYFENRACPYYPCHKDMEHINCMFCYCPMYRFDDCLGQPEYKEKDGRRIKVCTGCSYPHEKSHYGNILSYLKSINGRNSIANECEN